MYAAKRAGGFVVKTPASEDFVQACSMCDDTVGAWLNRMVDGAQLGVGELLDGMVQAPTGAGLGIDYDWDFIENHTVEKL